MMVLLLFDFKKANGVSSLIERLKGKHNSVILQTVIIYSEKGTVDKGNTGECFISIP